MASQHISLVLKGSSTTSSLTITTLPHYSPSLLLLTLLLLSTHYSLLLYYFLMLLHSLTTLCSLSTYRSPTPLASLLPRSTHLHYHLLSSIYLTLNLSLILLDYSATSLYPLLSLSTTPSPAGRVRPNEIDRDFSLPNPPARTPLPCLQGPTD